MAKANSICTKIMLMYMLSRYWYQISCGQTNGSGDHCASLGKVLTHQPLLRLLSCVVQWSHQSESALRPPVLFGRSGSVGLLVFHLTCWLQNNLYRYRLWHTTLDDQITTSSALLRVRELNINVRICYIIRVELNCHGRNCMSGDHRVWN